MRALIAIASICALSAPSLAVQPPPSTKQSGKPYLEDLRVNAEKGDALSQYSLGIRYRYVSENIGEATKWLSKAASTGHRQAMTELGKIYAEGLGVPLSYEKAANWFKKAADLGDVEAQHALAEAYVDGHGVPKDFIKAYMWFNIASSTGLDPTASISRDMLENRMSHAQVAEAQRLSSEWKPTTKR